MSMVPFDDRGVLNACSLVAPLILPRCCGMYSDSPKLLGHLFAHHSLSLSDLVLLPLKLRNPATRSANPTDPTYHSVLTTVMTSILTCINLIKVIACFVILTHMHNITNI